MVILYQKQGNLVKVADTLKQMNSLYGEDYNIYKRYAFMEVERQNMLPQESRNYSRFADYYEKAESMYYAQLKDNKSDTEMDLLANVKGQLQSGGWL